MFSVVTAFTVLQERNQGYQAAQEDADRNVSRNIEAISLALWNFDKFTLEATLVALTQSGSIVRAEVRDIQKQPVSRIDRVSQRTKPDIEWEIPIRAPDESKQIGTLKIAESYADMREFFASNLASRLIFEVIKIGGLAALLFIVIYTVVARHLQTLVRDVSDANPGSVPEPVRLQRKKVYHDELDKLVDSINRFRSQRVEAESALWATRSELARVTQMTTAAQMAAAIAHQISQSLTAIAANSIAALRWLARSPPHIDEASTALRNVAQDAHHASEVIRSIRAMFQKDSQKLTSVNINGSS
jgi:methyl-accepting chemotaxis protein